MCEWEWPTRDPDLIATQLANSYDLPPLFPDGSQPSIYEWGLQRKRLLAGFAEYVYGFTPAGGSLAKLTQVSEESVFESRATKTEWVLTVAGPRGCLDLPMLVYQPAPPKRPAGAPVFLGLNIIGNHAVGSVPGTRSETWMQVAWPIRQILERGYGIATIFNDSIEPDTNGAAWCGVRGLFQDERELRSQGPVEWGALGAWAWGLSRARDALDQIAGIDGTQVIVHGHSRLGMAALWAAAQDERFAGAVSSESGLGGASLTRHLAGEDIGFASGHFPHWFCGNYATFAGRDSEIPFDQHQLLALIAPRPVHVSSASLDRHADPEGEYLATLHASPAYELLGADGTFPKELRRAGFDVTPSEARSVPEPEVGQRVGSTLSYHIRYGAHGVTEFDWSQFLDFADSTVVAQVAASEGAAPEVFEATVEGSAGAVAGAECSK